MPVIWQGLTGGSLATVQCGQTIKSSVTPLELDKLILKESLDLLNPKTRAPLTVPSRPSERWSLDFVPDGSPESRRLRILAVIDDYTREYLCLVADTSLSGEPWPGNRTA